MNFFLLNLWYNLLHIYLSVTQLKMIFPRKIHIFLLNHNDRTKKKQEETTIGSSYLTKVKVQTQNNWRKKNMHNNRRLKKMTFFGLLEKK